MNSTTPLRSSLSTSLSYDLKNNSVVSRSNPENSKSKSNRKLGFSLTNNTKRGQGVHKKSKSLFSNKNNGKLSSSVISDALSYIQKSE